MEGLSEQEHFKISYITIKHSALPSQHIPCSYFKISYITIKLSGTGTSRSIASISKYLILLLNSAARLFCSKTISISKYLILLLNGSCAYTPASVTDFKISYITIKLSTHFCPLKFKRYFKISYITIKPKITISVKYIFA